MWLKSLVWLALLSSAVWAQQSYPFFSPSPAPPLLVTATANSPFGQSSYCYWVVVVYPIGKSTPSVPSCVPNAIETSSVLISWSAAQGASSYDVLRTTTPILPNVTSSIAVATAVSGTTQTDSFGALSSYTISSAVPATANLYLDNTAFSTPQLRAVVTGVGGTTAFNLSSGGGTPGGANGQIQYNNAGAFGGFTVSGDATLNTGTGVLTIGNGAVTNVKLANSATTVNGQTCTLGSTCNANAAAAAHSVALNEGSGSAIAGATIGTSGRLLIDQGAAADPSFNAVSGDATITGTGLVTVTQVNGAAVPTSAKLISTNGSKQLVAAAAETSPITVGATGGISCATCATTTNGGALSATLPVTISAAGVIALNAVTGSGNTVVEQTSPTITTPTIGQINDTNGNAEMIFTTTASAVDQLTCTNGATGNPGNVTCTATGTDTNINLTLKEKGLTGVSFMQLGASGTPVLLTTESGAEALYVVRANGNGTFLGFGGLRIGNLSFLGFTNGGPTNASDTTFGRQSAGLIDLGNGALCSTAANCRDMRYRHTFAQGTAPTLTNGTGTITGGDERFRVTLTAASQTTVTVTFGTAYTTNIPAFVCNDETTAANNPVQAQPTLSTVVINATGTFGAADKISCVGGGIIGP